METVITPRSGMENVLVRLVNLANHTVWNRLWHAIGFASRYHCESGDAVSCDGYRGISHYVKYGAETIAVLTLWEGFEDRFVIGSRPKRGSPHRPYFARLCRNLRKNGIRVEYGVR